METEQRRPRRRRVLIATVAVLVALQGAALVAITPAVQMRYDVWSARQALGDGDLETLFSHLDRWRGDREFAYRFTSGLTPREIGDGVGSVAGTGAADPLRSDIDPFRYELALTQLAGVMSLATHGTGRLALPDRWAKDFATAMTDPSRLYRVKRSMWDKNPFSRTDGEKRRDQDKANRSNLLLLLARGYWSTDVLRTITRTFYAHEREEGDDAWPKADPGDDFGWAPAPNGVYLTDGILALTGALAANAEASAWAFTDLDEGRVEVDGSERRIGRFTHFLMFEHEFRAGPSGESLGLTASLMALTSAIRSTAAHGVDDADAARAAEDLRQDARVLKEAAADATRGTDCSFNPLSYGNCVVGAFKKVWAWIRGWGHVVLKILTVARYAPPPFLQVGITAGLLEAALYAIEGDFASAGLAVGALSRPVSKLNVAKAAKAARLGGAIRGAKALALAKKASGWSKPVRKVADAWRAPQPWQDCDRLPPRGIRLTYATGWTREQREAAELKARDLWQASTRDRLVKATSTRSTTSGAALWKKRFGPVPRGMDVDHTHDLELGGRNDLSNLRLLDSAVNEHLRRQVAAQLELLGDRERVAGIAIC